MQEIKCFCFLLCELRNVDEEILELQAYDTNKISEDKTISYQK